MLGGIYIVNYSMKWALILCFVGILFTMSCKKYDTKLNTAPLPDVPASFTALLDGRRITWKADSVGFNDTAYVFTEVIPNDSSYNFYFSELFKIGRWRIEFVRQRLGFWGNTPSQFDFRNYFLPGNYSFAYSAPNYPQHGFSINFYDGAKEYTTEGINNSQTPGGFRIESITDGTNKRGEYQVNVVCKFNCNLYDLGRTDIRTITQGEFRGSFVYR
jgi:hypothetical protein